MTYLEEGMEYDADGNIVDSRNRIIRDLKSQVANFRNRDYGESQQRVANPALQDAWDHYQTLLTLTRVEE